MSTVEKINSRLTLFSHSRPVLTPTSPSQACSFPPFTFDPSHTGPVIGSQIGGLLPDPGFLLSAPTPTDLPYALLTQILSMAC